MALVSPGVEIQVIDESIAGSSGPGTIPLIFIATQQNKTINTALGPVFNTVASGTVTANAGELYLITSQRELIQTFGDPVFYENQGTPIPGYELNEYGLLAAYQFLGISNRAYVIRADLDLAQMLPTNFEPTNPPFSGTYWLDLTETSWGIFKSDGSSVPGTAWQSQIPLVVSRTGQTENVVVSEVGFDENTTAVAVTGNLEINGVIVSINNSDTIEQVALLINTANITSIRATVLRYSDRSWLAIRNLDAGKIDIGGDSTVVTGLGFDNQTVVRHPSFTLGQNGDFAVMPILGDNLYYEKIRPTGLLGESDPDAVAFWFLIGSDTWRRTSTTVATGITLTNYLSNPLASSDQLTISNGDDSVTITFGVADVNTLNNVIAKINLDLVNASMNDKFVSMLDVNNRIAVVNIEGGNLILTGSTGVTALLGFTTTNINRNRVYYSPHFQVPAGSRSGDIWVKTTNPNAGADYIVKIYSRTTSSWTTIPAPFYLNDDKALSALSTSAAPGTLYTRFNLYGTVSDPITSQILRRYTGAGTVDIIGDSIPGVTTPSLVPGDQFVLTVGTPNGGGQDSQIITITGSGIADVITDINNSTLPNILADSVGGFLRISNTSGYSLTIGYFDPNTNAFVDTANTDDPIASLGFTDGLNASRFTDLTYSASVVAPTTEAESGRLWFNDDFLADIMVGDGDQWIGLRNAFPSVDPQGVIIAGSAPEFQTDGTPLVENDLWLDGSDSENYPALYRYRALTKVWEPIDTTDQTTPFGIVFGDARWSVDGQRDGDRTQAGLTKSDFLDPDAPDPRTYPAGMLLFNTRASTNNVKRWIPNYLAEFVGQEESPGVQYSVGLSDFPTDTITTANQGRWVTASGNEVDGSPFMGRKAQRRLVIQSIAADIISNQDIRAETAFYNLIAAPGYPELIDEMVTLNTDIKEVAFIVGDTPARLEPDGTSIQRWATNANNVASTGDEGLTVANTYVGLYYPWALSTNTNGQEVVVPPSNLVLRTIAFNDNVAYPWFAPAGFNRGLITNAGSVGYINSEDEYQPVILNPGQRDTLYVNNINPLAYMPNKGLVVFGQKTLHPNETSALSRVNVVRLINFLRFNYDVIAKPFLFEPNDKQTRDQVTSVFERFTGNLVSLRALYDFAVVCDESNNTPDRIDRNELWIDVAIQPVKAIEFIYIPIRIRNTGEDLTNLLPGV